MGRSVERVARLLTKVFRVATVPSSTVPIYTATAGFRRLLTTRGRRWRRCWRTDPGALTEAVRLFVKTGPMRVDSRRSYGRMGSGTSGEARAPDLA
jgi:hypothetical protein